MAPPSFQINQEALQLLGVLTLGQKTVSQSLSLMLSHLLASARWPLLERGVRMCHVCDKPMQRPTNCTEASQCRILVEYAENFQIEKVSGHHMGSTHVCIWLTEKSFQDLRILEKTFMSNFLLSPAVDVAYVVTDMKYSIAHVQDTAADTWKCLSDGLNPFSVDLEPLPWFAYLVVSPGCCALRPFCLQWLDLVSPGPAASAGSPARSPAAPLALHSTQKMTSMC